MLCECFLSPYRPENEAASRAAFRAEFEGLLAFQRPPTNPRAKLLAYSFPDRRWQYGTLIRGEGYRQWQKTWDEMFLTFACAKLLDGYTWTALLAGDWEKVAAGEVQGCLTTVLHRLHLGAAVAPRQRQRELFYRLYETGVVAANTSDETDTLRLKLPADYGPLRNLYDGSTIRPRHDLLVLELSAMSGRVLVHEDRLAQALGSEREPIPPVAPEGAHRAPIAIPEDILERTRPIIPQKAAPVFSGAPLILGFNAFDGADKLGGEIRGPVRFAGQSGAEFGEANAALAFPAAGRINPRCGALKLRVRPNFDVESAKDYELLFTYAAPNGAYLMLQYAGRCW